MGLGRYLLDIKNRIGRGTLGKQSLNTIFGDKITAERHADIEEQFHYNINTKTLTKEEVDTGTVTIEDDMLKLSTGSGTSAEAHLETKKVIRYRPGFEAFTLFTALFESNPIGCIQRIGPFTGVDGYYVGFGTDGLFEVGRVNTSTVIPIKETAFNGDKRFSQIDKTKLNVWSISYGWLGSAAIFYNVMLPDGEWINFHKEKTAGTEIKPHSSNPQLPIHGEVTKTSGATDVIMRCGSWCGGINGTDTGAGDRFFPITQAVSISAGVETLLFSLRVVSTFQGKTNRVLIELIKRILTTDGNKVVTFRAYRNLTIATPTWVDIDAINSVVQKDILGTPTYDLTKLDGGLILGKLDRETELIRNQGFEYFPGDILTFSAESANISDVSLSLREREEF